MHAPQWAVWLGQVLKLLSLGSFYQQRGTAQWLLSSLPALASQHREGIQKTQNSLYLIGSLRSNSEDKYQCLRPPKGDTRPYIYIKW